MGWLQRIWKAQHASSDLHPAVRVAVAVVMVALTMDMLMGVKQTALLVVVALADWLAAFAYVFMPTVGSAFALTLWGVGLMLPVMDGYGELPYGSWTLLAVVLLGMAWALLLGMRCRRMALCLSGVDVLAVLCCGLCQGSVRGTAVGPLQSVEVAATVAGALGFAVYLGRVISAHRLRLLSRRSWALRHRVGTATAPLHDVTCNDLCYALQRLDIIRPKVSGDDAKALTEVRDVLEESLQATRASMTVLRGLEIRSLNGDARGLGSACLNKTEPPLRRLDIANLVQEHERKLEALGFHGVVLVDSDCATLAMGADVAAVVTGLINELFGNVLKYADPSRGYSFTCGMNGSRLRVELCDAPGEGNGGLMERSTGAGLAHYQQELRQRGGALTLRGDAEIWLVVACVPVEGQATTGAAGADMNLYRTALVVWTVFVALMFGATQLVPVGDRLLVVLLVMYIAGPVASIVFSILGVLHSWKDAALLTLISIAASALGSGALTLGDWDWTRNDPHAWWALRAAVAYGCAMGAVPALLGIVIGAVVRWAMHVVQAARRTTGGRRRMGIMVAAATWGVFAIATILVCALAIPASATPLPWTYPVIPAALMLACGCTALIHLSAQSPDAHH